MMTTTKSRTFAIAIGGFVIAGFNSADASGYHCDFSTMCYEETGCQPKTLRIEILDLEEGKADLVTPGSTVRMTRQLDSTEGIVSGTVAYSSELTRDTMYLLTVYPDQSSRLSIHAYLNDALTIEARGVCAIN